MSIEAMKKALKALQGGTGNTRSWHLAIEDAIIALRTAIQQAEAKTVEPVVWISKTGHGTYFRESITHELASLEHGGRKMWRPLTYADTHPAPGVPAWVVSTAKEVVLNLGPQEVILRYLTESDTKRAHGVMLAAAQAQKG